MKGIGIMGGAFNPCTSAHLELAESVLFSIAGMEKIIFLPVGDRYIKKGLIQCIHRIKMLELACRDNPRFGVSDLECNSDKLLSTIDSLRILKDMYKEYEIYFLMGTDNLRDLPNWAEFEALIKSFKFVIFERGEKQSIEIIENNDMLNKYKENFVILKNQVISSSSSTIVRECINKNKSFKWMVPEAVYNYIIENNLYK
ncbi:MAG: nicotinate (nicotinamide) nucleotide adenylyltransferase [Solirubrobacterales bacterium]